MSDEPKPSKDPLHGVTLEQMLVSLVDYFGWEKLGKRIDIRCFTSDPSIPSSLKFLRKTPWARTQVESLYVASQRWAQKDAARGRRRGEAVKVAAVKPETPAGEGENRHGS